MIVPAYLSRGGSESTAEDAHFVLVDVQAGQDLTSDVIRPFAVPYAQETTCGIIRHLDGFNLMYVWLKCVSDLTPTLMGVVGANISGNFRVGVCQENHRDFYSSDECHIPHYLYQDTWSKIRSVRSLPKSRITQFHHNFVSWRELNALYDAIKPTHTENKHRLATASYFCDHLRRLGFDNRVSAITMLVYIAVVPAFALKHLMFIMINSADPDQFMANLKFEGGAAKQLQNIFRNDLSAVFELQVLRNRVYDEVNWSKERSNRTEPSVVPINSKVVFDRACSIFSSARQNGHLPRRVSWDEYWAMI